MMRSAQVALAAVWAFVLSITGASVPALPATANAPVVLITLENTEYSQVHLNPYANYLNCTGKYLPSPPPSVPGFTCQGTLYKNYYSVQHHSLPNYLDLTSGGDNGCLTDSCPTSGYAETSLFGQLGASGSSYLSLQESMPSPCDKKSSGSYAVRHNPELYSADAATTCGNTDIGVPDSFPSPDVWPNPLPSFSVITPNLCHDAHGLLVKRVQTCAASTVPAEDCTPLSGQSLNICNADNWLAANVPALLNQTPQPIVVISFDEGTTAYCGDGAGGGAHACGGNVMTAVVGPRVPVNAVDSSGPYSHFSLLRGLEDFYGLPCQQDACAAVPIPIPQATTDIGVPNTPGPISVTAGSLTVGITWAAAVDADPEPIAGYEVDRSGDGGTSWVQMGPEGAVLATLPLSGGVISSGTNSYTDSSVKAGVTYTYEVRTVDPHGNASGWTTPSVPVPATYNCGQTSSVLPQCAAGHKMSAIASVTLRGTNVKSGDLLLAVIGASGLSTTGFCVATRSVPSPWLLVGSSPTAMPNCANPEFNTTMYSVVNAAAQTCPCTVTFKLSAAEDWTMWVGDYAGVAATSPLDAFAESDSGALPATTMNAGPTAATTQPSDLAVAALWNDSSLPGLGPSTTGTDPGSWSEVDVIGQGGGAWMEVLQKLVTSSGVTVEAQDALTSGAKVRGLLALFKTG